MGRIFKKHSIERIIAYISLTILAFSVIWSCTKKEKEVEVTSVSIIPPAAELVIGEKLQLKATVLPSDATNKVITWSSSRKSVATVNGNGLVAAVEEGTAMIYASAGGKNGPCTITVIKPAPTVSSISLDKTELMLEEEATVRLTATITPAEAVNTPITWTSSKPEVASVTGGSVKGIKEGTSIITATSGGKSAKCTITVKKKLIVSSISLYPTILSLEEGQTAQITATIIANLNDATASWTSSNTSVATVDGGLVKAIKEGTATITAACGGKSAKCTVTVKKKTIPVTSISLSQTTLNLEEGESVTLTAIVNPSNSTDRTVVWSSDNTATATVSGGIVKAIKEGTAAITASCGGKSAKCSVTVKKKSIPVTSITLSQTTLNLEEGESATIIASITPSNATSQIVHWNSLDPSIATVNDGTVTAIKAGMTVIDASCGEKSATCSVTVIAKMPPEAVDLGLSVYWASSNLGKSGLYGSPSGYGAYYAWGEVETKSRYDYESYKWCNGTSTTLTKYCTSSSYGTVDNITELQRGEKPGETVDDVARAKLGGKWRMPTAAEFSELYENCTISKTTLNGVNGRKFTSKKSGYTSKWIFLPDAGWMSGKFLYYDSDDDYHEGYYWTSSLYTDGPSYCAWGYTRPLAQLNHPGRYLGCSVRPVCDKYK